MKSILLMLVLINSIDLLGAAQAPKTLKIYSSRKSHLLKPLVDLYKKKTGHRIEIINGDAGVLIQRILQEGASSPADLLMTVDAGNLWYAASQQLFSPLSSKILTRYIPPELRDPQGRWFGLSLRARTIFFNKTKVKAQNIKSYENLASSEFKGRLCLRTSRKVYNQSLVASLIDRLGEASAAAVVAGWVQNLEKPVFTSDTLLLKAIDRGQCDVGIANTYYLARLQKKGQASNVGVFWPNQPPASALKPSLNQKSSGGVHVNISGAGVIATSSNKKGAQEFLEFVLSDEAQSLFAKVNDEYPVKAGVSVSPLLKSWGDFERDRRSMAVYGALQRKAIQIMDKARYR